MEFSTSRSRISLYISIYSLFDNDSLPGNQATAYSQFITHVYVYKLGAPTEVPTAPIYDAAVKPYLNFEKEIRYFFIDCEEILTLPPPMLFPLRCPSANISTSNCRSQTPLAARIPPISTQTKLSGEVCYLFLPCLNNGVILLY